MAMWALAWVEWLSVFRQTLWTERMKQLCKCSTVVAGKVITLNHHLSPSFVSPYALRLFSIWRTGTGYPTDFVVRRIRPYHWAFVFVVAVNKPSLRGFVSTSFSIPRSEHGAGLCLLGCGSGYPRDFHG